MGFFDFIKIFKKQRMKQIKVFIPPVEEDTECDKCWNLQECKEKGCVVNNTWWSDNREHWIKGRGCICVASCQYFSDLKLSEIKEMATDKEMIKFIDKAIEQLGDMTYKEFFQDGKFFEMTFE